MRPLSYQTPQYVNRARNCGVQSLDPAIDKHYGVKNGENKEAVVGF